jgi:anti-sigma regulatory factor (Ser/Thr protein kinase)
MSREGPRDVHQRLPALPASVGRLRRIVVSFAGRSGATLRQREDIALALSEALSNAVQHAYHGCDRPGMIDVRASRSDDALVVAVRDDGIGLDARVDSPGLGLGLGLIGQVTERLELIDALPGLCVRMTFTIT